MRLIFANPKGRPGQYLFEVVPNSATFLTSHNVGIAGNLDHEAHELLDVLPKHASLNQTTSIVLSGGGQFQIGPCQLQRGEYYPRVFRPLYFAESHDHRP